LRPRPLRQHGRRAAVRVAPFRRVVFFGHLPHAADDFVFVEFPSLLVAQSADVVGHAVKLGGAFVLGPLGLTDSRTHPVSHNRHPQLHQHRGRDGGILVVLVLADVPAQEDDRLGERVLNHLLARRRQELAERRPVLVGQAFDLFDRLSQVLGRPLPRPPIRAQLRDLDEDRVHDRLVRNIVDDRIVWSHGALKDGSARQRVDSRLTADRVVILIIYTVTCRRMLSHSEWTYFQIMFSSYCIILTCGDNCFDVGSCRGAV